MPKTILVLAANPVDTSRLSLGQEIREIEAALERAKYREQFKLAQQPATRIQDVRRALLKYKPAIVHFCGHGEGEAGIVFEDEGGESKLVSADALAGLFELFSSHIECVLLNACYSAIQAEAIARHIPYVIGMRQAIQDVAAKEFAAAFYDAIGAEEQLEFAYRLGCNAIQSIETPQEGFPILKTIPAPAVDSPHYENFAGKIVFLAETPDALYQKREEVKTYLEQHEIRVLPEKMYYFPSVEGMKNAICADLQRADLFVQLLENADVPRQPELSTPLQQYSLAKDCYPSLPRLHWRDPDLELAADVDAEYGGLWKTSTLVLVSLEKFKRQIIRHFETRHKVQDQQAKLEALKQEQDVQNPGQCSTNNKLIFVNASPEDINLAADMSKLFNENGFPYSLPVIDHLSPSQKREDLEHNLLACGILVVIYDQASVVWVREQVLYCQRIDPRRDYPLQLIAIFNRTGRPKPPVNVNLPNMCVIDFESPEDADILTKFLKELQP